MAQTLSRPTLLKRRKATASHPPTRKKAVTERTGGPVNHRTLVGEHRSTATRARILAAAAQVFSVKGMDTPVIDDFVRAAGISRGTFYNYFSTTTELLDATVEWLREDMNRSIVKFVSGMSDPVQQSATAMRLYLRWATTTPMLSACVGRLPQISASAWMQARKEMVEGMRRGAFTVPSVDVACDLAFGTLGEAIRRAAREPETPLVCDDVVAVILTGLGVHQNHIREAMALPLPTLPPSSEKAARPFA